jgi:ABC-type multidrug transport system ATPase subunit
MLVEIENLTKTFGDFRAVDNVSFSIDRGQIIGLLGPNGAGKTTTIHMILGLITPTSGRISIFGKSIATDREEILEQTNFTSPYTAFPYRLTVLENLKIFARIYNLQRPRERIDELLERFGITKLRDKAIAKLSSGENTRVGLCKAFMNDPRLLLLDEPTEGLAPIIVDELLKALGTIARSGGICSIIVEQNAQKILGLADRVVILERGAIVHDAASAALKADPAVLERYLGVSGAAAH